jgi:tight adherence protein C
MSGLAWVMMVTTFVTISAIIYGVLVYSQNRRKVVERIRKSSSSAVSAVSLLRRGEQDHSLKKRFLDWVSSFGQFGLKDQEETSKLKSSLIQAGFRNQKGPAIFFGLRVLTAVCLPLIYLVAIITGSKSSTANLLYAFGLTGLGFYLPNYVLKVMIRKRQDRIDKGLPDVLDLLIVCMEAGLALQAAILRVSEEIKTICRDFYVELQLLNAELRAGIPREMALKNLSDRTGVQNVKSLVSMMTQSDRMGASIAQALRTQAQFLRVQRGQRAEELAAKLPVKILFPMIFFIFPAIFIVILGPAIIQVSKTTMFR